VAFIIKSKLQNSFYIHAGITVGLMETSYNTPEIGGPLSVCVEMFNGNLARNVSLTIATSDGTAIGMTYGHAYAWFCHEYKTIQQSYYINITIRL
jgi:hypothetical protein